MGMGSSFFNLLLWCGYRENQEAFPEVPPSVRSVFEQYADPSGIMTSKALLKFFQEYQKEKAVLQGPIASMLLAFPSSAAAADSGSGGMGKSFVPKKKVTHSMSFLPSKVDSLQRSISQRMGAVTIGSKAKSAPAAEPNAEQFFRLLLEPVATAPVSSKVSQNMKLPLSHYFIYTGHNSYLRGNQLTSESSTKPIIKALRRGVRVIELDLWPNGERSEILVMHGGTLTRPVGFDDCIVAIKAHAFEASEFPVIITLEDHLPPNLQAKAAESLVRILGDMLFCPKDGQMLEEFPSPLALRHRIVVSTQPPKDKRELVAVATDAERDPANASGRIPASGESAGEGAAAGGKVPAEGSLPVKATVGEAQASEEWSGLKSAGRGASFRSLLRIGDSKSSGGREGKEGKDPKELVSMVSRKGRKRSSGGSWDLTAAVPPDEAPVSLIPAVVDPVAKAAAEAAAAAAKAAGGAPTGDLHPPATAAAEAAAAGPAGEGRGEGAAAVGESGTSTASQTPASSQSRLTDARKEGQEEIVEDAVTVLLDKVSEYRRLISIPGGKLRKGVTIDQGLCDGKQGPVKRISLSESQLMATVRSAPTSIVSFTQRNLLRVYPFGLRVRSSNYNPMPAWLHGAQMVAMNMQGHGKPLWLVHGFFRANGGCGYVKKPDAFLQPPARPTASMRRRAGGRRKKRASGSLCAPTLTGKGASGPITPKQGSSSSGSGSGALLADGAQGQGTPRSASGVPAAPKTRGEAAGAGEAETGAPVAGSRGTSAALGEEGERGGEKNAGEVVEDGEVEEDEEEDEEEEEEFFNPSTLNRVQMILKVQVVVGLGWLERFGKEYFDKYSAPDFACKISIEGLPADCEEKRLEVRTNKFCPSWDGVTLEFPLLFPDIALLCIEVLEMDTFQGEFAGQVVLPVASLRPGFRCVSLFDRKGRPLVQEEQGQTVGPRLLCHFAMHYTEDYTGKAEAAGGAIEQGKVSALSAFEAAMRMGIQEEEAGDEERGGKAGSSKDSRSKLKFTQDAPF